jgi:hypothetical protein
VEIRSRDAMLEGWWITNPQVTNPATMIYFGGNAEDVLHMSATGRSYNAKRILVVNYRGYGRSTGQPNQEALYEDALAIYDFAISAPEVDRNHIVVMGRSLGSGLAAMLASQRPVAGAILITPFDSLVNVAAHHYPFFPVRLLLRHHFPSSDWAKTTKAPALIIAGEQDSIIPPLHAQRLHDAWAGEKQIHVMEGVGHNDIELHPEYYGLVNEFLLNVENL